LPSLQLRDIAQAFLKRPGVILLVVLGFVGPTLGVSLWQTPLYEASAKLVVGQKPPDPTQDYFLLSHNVEGLQLILPAVVEAIPTRPVAEEAIQRLGLRMEPAELVENLSVDQEGSTVFIQLSYRDASPERAQQIVNAVGAVSSERIPEATGIPDDVTVTMYEEASVPTTPVSPNPLRNGLLALLFGLMVAPVLAILMSAWGDVATSIGHSAHQIARSVGRTASRTRGTPAGEPMTEAAKEREVLEALGRLGELTAAEAALETSLTVEEAERVLSGLAAKGHLRVRVLGNPGGIFYSFWERDAPE
jgi:capsular polysaccharide biosynthesis protein